MVHYLEQRKSRLPYRILSGFVAFTFMFSMVTPPTPLYAQNTSQTILNLPPPGEMVRLSDGYAPAVIKALTINPQNPLQFDFIVDTGDSKLKGEALKDESNKLIKYFLASLTVPDEDMWVNLSPYEKGRIIPEGFSVTEMGRDLLAQDYILKQMMASLIYPEDDLGKEFWARVYKKAQEQFGTTNIPVNTFNKVWIVPENALVYEYEGSAYVVDSHLKVMLEEDYLALQSNLGNKEFSLDKVNKDDAEALSGVSSAVIREVLIPEIEKEVNTGTHFANLRQIYNSMVLATWYKQNLKETLLGQVYVDKTKVKGVDVEDKQVKQKIYDQYVEAFNKGVYNYIKEDYDPVAKHVVPRKYFSGGFERDGAEVKTVRGRSGFGSSPVSVQQRIRRGMEKNSIDSRYVVAEANLIENTSDKQLSAAKVETSSPVATFVELASKHEDLNAVGKSVYQEMEAFLSTNVKGRQIVKDLQTKLGQDESSINEAVTMSFLRSFTPESFRQIQMGRNVLNEKSVKQDFLPLLGLAQKDFILVSVAGDVSSVSESLSRVLLAGVSQETFVDLTVAIANDTRDFKDFNEQISELQNFVYTAPAVSSPVGRATQNGLNLAGRTFRDLIQENVKGRESIGAALVHLNEMAAKIGHDVSGRAFEIFVQFTKEEDTTFDMLAKERGWANAADGLARIAFATLNSNDTHYFNSLVQKEISSLEALARVGQSHQLAASSPIKLTKEVLRSREYLEKQLEDLGYTPEQTGYVLPLVFQLGQENPVLSIEKDITPADAFEYEDMKKIFNIIDVEKEVLNRTDYIAAARQVDLTISHFNAGFGESVIRNQYLQHITGRQALAAKSQDLFHWVEVEGRDEKNSPKIMGETVAVLELKYLSELNQSLSYGSVKIEELVNEDSKRSLENFYNTTYFWDRVNDSKSEEDKRTWEEAIKGRKRIKVVEPMVLLPYPVVNPDIGEFYTDGWTANGSHGAVVSIKLQSLVEKQLPEEGTSINVFLNADGVNNQVPREIVGKMMLDKLPIGVITATRIGKVGDIGDEKVGAPHVQKEGDSVVFVNIELGQAQVSGQRELFLSLGRRGKGIQPINTNTILINETILKPLLQKIVNKIGVEQFLKIVSPDVIPKERYDEQSGREGISVEGAAYSVVMNIDKALKTMDELKDVRDEFRKETGHDGLLFHFNFSPEIRSKAFTPNKFTLHQWTFMQQKKWGVNIFEGVLTDATPGSFVDGEVNVQYDMWDLLVNLGFDADINGNVEFFIPEGLPRLTDHRNVRIGDQSLGEMQKLLPGPYYRGKVQIIDKSGGLFDLFKFNENYFKEHNKYFIPKTEDGQLSLSDVRIVIDGKGKVTKSAASSPLAYREEKIKSASSPVSFVSISTDDLTYREVAMTGGLFFRSEYRDDERGRLPEEEHFTTRHVLKGLAEGEKVWIDSDNRISFPSEDVLRELEEIAPGVSEVLNRLDFHASEVGSSPVVRTRILGQKRIFSYYNVATGMTLHEQLPIRGTKADWTLREAGDRTDDNPRDIAKRQAKQAATEKHQPMLIPEELAVLSSSPVAELQRQEQLLVMLDSVLRETPSYDNVADMTSLAAQHRVIQYDGGIDKGGQGITVVQQNGQSTIIFIDNTKGDYLSHSETRGNDWRGFEAETLIRELRAGLSSSPIEISEYDKFVKEVEGKVASEETQEQGTLLSWRHDLILMINKMNKPMTKIRPEVAPVLDRAQKLLSRVEAKLNKNWDADPSLSPRAGEEDWRLKKTSSSQVDVKNVGGINLNSAMLNLQIKRDGNGIPLPLPQQPIQNMNIEGFLPVIINVTPIPSLPMIFSEVDEEGPE
ncbi:MAG: hypothetical protein KAJ18_04175, partial [Candidatus Omnitrophica bacterium]|nr:hypothetical protein [Candidatus Omnitrophota bacterium]